VPLYEKFSLNENIKKEVAINRYWLGLVWKRLQIVTYLSRIITSTGDELFDGFKRPWTPSPKWWVLCNFW